MSQANDLEILLVLNGETMLMDSGHWTKFEAYLVTPSPHIPHGIRYSLTLHDRYNKRLIGFDNAHAIKTKTHKYAARKITWDHQHKREEVINYEFSSAGQLVEDFWNAVNTLLDKDLS